MSDENNNVEIEEEYEADILTLEDEDGVEHTFEVLDASELGGVRYMALAPYEADPAKRLEEEAEMIIMKVAVDESGEEVLDVVDDEDELYDAGQMFINRLSDVYDIDIDELVQQLRADEDEDNSVL